MVITYSPPADTGLDILYQDDYLLAVNKPCGLLSVPGKDQDKQDCLSLRVQMRFPAALIVHRLDMSTSGIMLMALGKDMQRELSSLFQQRQINKTYMAVVDGMIEEYSGIIDLPLITDWPNRPKQKVDYEAGKSSITCYTVIERNQINNSSRVELKPETGRSHQLRVHMQSIGHPIIGDRLYASAAAQAKASRMLLHATKVIFKHPVSNITIDIESQPDF
ncbi:MAG: pseudouridine synthase [Gammaproteobacteria bacterium]|nr:pseudouridine synthase [Gammaproteobacteria bacterium]